MSDDRETILKWINDPYQKFIAIIAFIGLSVFCFRMLTTGADQIGGKFFNVGHQHDERPAFLPDTQGLLSADQIGKVCNGKAKGTVVPVSPKYDYSCGGGAYLIIVHATGEIINLDGTPASPAQKARAFGTSFKHTDGKTYRADGNGIIEVGTVFRTDYGKYWVVKDDGIFEVPPTGSRTGKYVMGYGEIVK
jgi:hypothetical protein